MTYPKYDPETNTYVDAGELNLNDKLKVQIDFSDSFAVYKLAKAHLGVIQVLLLEDGYSLAGAKKLAQDHRSFATDSAVYVVAHRISGILQGVDMVQFIQDFPPPSLGHTPIIVDKGNNEFLFTFDPPMIVGSIGASSEEDFMNPNLEQIV